jgi:mannose PTS system EIIA component
MAISILIITHENVGNALLNVAIRIFEKLPLPPTISIPIAHDAHQDSILTEIRAALAKLDNHDGVLVLTDLYGATPNNLVRSLQDEVNVKVVTGVNLPMLIRVFNYSHLPLNLLAEKALSGGRDGVLNCAEFA